MRRILVACTLLGTIPLAALLPARAAVLTYNVTSNVKINATTTTNVVKLTHSGSLAMAAGEHRYLYGRILAYNAFTPNVLQDVGVDCDPNASRTAPSSGIMYTGRNNEGSDFAYPTGNGLLILYVRSLFTAPSTGTYDCALWGVAASSAWNGSTPYLTVKPKDAAGVQQSYLQVGAATEIGALKWGPAACGSKGTDATCIYLSAGQSRNDILYQASWNAATTATKATFYLDLEVTTCYTNTSSCTITGGNDYTDVDTRLEVYQLDATGHAAGCSPGQTYDPANPRVSRDAHHFKIYHQLTYTISTSSSCTRRFLARLYVKNLGGDPIKIDGPELSDGIALNAF
jgi:hypothetical protein